MGVVMYRFFRALLLGLLLLVCTQTAGAQNLDVTFRFIPDLSTEPPAVVRAYVPGTFNDWGPNSNGRIATNAPSLMVYDPVLNEHRKTVSLAVGSTHNYKFHYHLNADGSNYVWISDPLNDRVTGPNNDSVVDITDPMVFQPAREQEGTDLIQAVSAGLFGTADFTEITFEINGAAQDGLPFYDAATGFFRYELPTPIVAGSQFKITATDAQNRTVSAEVGEVQAPVAWITPDFSTYRERVTVEGRIARPNGTTDPSVTEATLLVNGEEQTVGVDNGMAQAEADLRQGQNELLLRAMVEGTTYTSAPLVITRLLHPLNDVLIANAEVTGSDNSFQITLQPNGELPLNQAFIWKFDAANSTAQLVSGPVDTRTQAFTFDGMADGSGMLYLDVLAGDFAASSDDFFELEIRVAVVIEADGTVREMRYEETPPWVNRAIVYEIFPLSFGPQAQGTPANPGNRFQQITDELDYIADMGFTVLWFMPIMHNRSMTPLGGGYNIIDFYNVDPKLGTNDDFKHLVARAHELGLKVILDITPSHVSEAHPWVNSLREQGEASPFYNYIQTTPSPHNRGLDNRGANLPEIWQTEGGRNLYRKYDGFGDLANVNWDDDDLQAAFLDIFAYWVREFDIDGWRMDVYWGPWRRYGPDRFGRPIRELMKRLKPDSWILAEIAGTGASTEVYYTDDDNGSSVVGGIDAGYDWPFYHDAIRSTYGNLSRYDAYAHNDDFWPGPNARYFRFLENHDEERIAKLYGAAPERILPLTGFLLTTTGIPMVYQGQEVNFGNVSGDARRLSVNWETARNGPFAEHHQQLAHARTQFPAFWTQELKTLSTSNDVYAYVRPFLDENAVVLNNFAASPRTVSINPVPFVEMTTDGPVPYTHLWADSTFFDLDGFEVTLRPYETLIFITAEEVDFTLPPLPALPFGAVYTSAEDAAVPGAFALDQNYPNPFNPATTIRYTLPAATHVTMEVFDILGRRVAVLSDGLQPTGTHEVVFDARSLPSGSYLYRLRAGDRTETRMMLLVK